MPYQSSGGRRNNVQVGVGRSLWGGTPPPPIPERVLDGIPGFAAWLALLFSVASAVAFPRFLLGVAAAVGLYSAARFLFAGVANVMGLRKIRQWAETDWYARYQADAPPDALPWDAVQHVVIIPNYKEPLPILRATLDNLARQYEAAARMHVVLAMEAGEPGSDRKGQQLCNEYAGQFANIFYTVHPRGLPGEMQCKSSNEAWAGRWVRRKLVDELGYDIDHVIVTTMDADTLWHPRFFYALTYLYATDPARHQRFWQAPIRYHANIWDINPLMRLVNAYATAFELAYLAAPWWMPVPISSYSLSLRLLEGAGYWDVDVIADELHMFIKAFFHVDAQLKAEPVFLPFLATATTGDTLWEAVKNRYQQTLRHAWGSKEVGYIIAKMLEHPDMDIRPTLRLLLRVSHDILLAGAGWIILTLGAQLPILLHPEIIPPLAEIPSDPTLLMLSIAGFLVVVLGIVFWWQDVIARPPRTTRITLRERLLTLISFPLLPLLTLIFVALPVIQAQTRLLAGMPLQFQVSRKV